MRGGRAAHRDAVPSTISESCGVGSFSRTASADECAVAPECGQVFSVGSPADVPVGADGEECGAVDAETGSCRRFEVSDRVQIGTSTEGDDGVEQRRVGGEVPHSSQDVRERGARRNRAAEEHERVARAVRELVKSTGFPG